MRAEEYLSLRFNPAFSVVEKSLFLMIRGCVWPGESVGQSRCLRLVEPVTSSHPKGTTMNKRRQHGEGLQADLEALAVQIEAGEREDRRMAAQERREDRERAAAGKPPKRRPRPDITTFEGFASGGVVPRE